MNLILAKIPEDKKEAFVFDIRATKNPEERLAVLEKYGVTLTEEEKESLKKEGTKKLSKEDLQMVSGGGCCNCGCNCNCACAYG